MHLFDNLIVPELIDLTLDVWSQDGLFEKVGGDLELQGFVTEHYINALKKREKEFPTGLETRYMNISLPHADPEVVNKPFIYIARTIKPITVLQMGDNKELETRDFFFLGITDPEAQLGLLAKLMDLFGEEEFVNELKAINNETEILHLMQARI